MQSAEECVEFFERNLVGLQHGTQGEQYVEPAGCQTVQGAVRVF